MSKNMTENKVELLVQKEEFASDKIWPEVQDHINYLSTVYTLCFAFSSITNNQTVTRNNPVFIAKIMILMRISDFIRSIQLLVSMAYPEQAATLTASIFELAHTGASFSYLEGTAEKWLTANSIENRMPNLLGNNIKSWKDLIKNNVAHFGSDNYIYEYQVYEQLCWMKHSHPIIQGLIFKDNYAKFQVGPYSDENSIRYAWFSMNHAGRLASFFMFTLLKGYPDIYSHLNDVFDQVSTIGFTLDKKGKERFPEASPFKTEM